ncbi:hypothetical protein Cgig2_023714 [Carnegiea gigantea]|uniref:CRM domain-containing protein n=1 Tax=Carnegiea gigantea TaxID=171969 RepID=A0A9Q1KKV0_9CARY|nr:hypothetical protein Cgig2_023714 [Carnegiea gigantea]
MPPFLSSYHHRFAFSSKPPFHRRHHHHHPHHPCLLSLLPPTFPLLIQNLRASNSSSTNTPPPPGDRETLPQSAIQRIAEKLRTLGFVEESQTEESNAQLAETGEIFIPDSRQIPSYRVGHTLDPSWSSPQSPFPDPGTGNAIVRLHESRGVAKKESGEVKEQQREKGEAPTLAELTLPGSEIRRLTTIGIRMKTKMMLGKAGITEGVVNGIHERWRSSEVVKIVCEDICRLNMKRTHDLLERKTGGVVVWRAGSKILLYRGANYEYPYFSLDEASSGSSSKNDMNSADDLRIREESLSSETHIVESAGENSRRILNQSSLIQGVGSPTRVRFLLPGEKQLIEEADQLLQGLGPRFTDWWGCDRLPIDGDLLPAVVPGYRKPFRLLPYGVNRKLTNDEMTVLKRLGQPLPCHFALGRNRNLQGLAAAMLKLWEKCEIAKIAIKRGIQNTNSELMAEELKHLTGGILLSRDKEYIVFYRGKDFLPSAVSLAIEKRRKSRRYGEKQLINISSTTIGEESAPSAKGHVPGGESETSGAHKVSQERKTKSIEAAIMRTDRKLSMAWEEKARAERLLSDLEQAEISQEAEVDTDGITEEERYMLRRVGLRMKPFLLLGRRGVFDGTIQNMHLHWKYRELVKIICGGRNIDEIHNVARTLEAESGGILVAVDKVRKGYAIIVYRGKNYQRPACLRPRTLLNKKEALKRSIEAQRREVEDQRALDIQTKDQLLESQGLGQDELNPTISNDSTNPQDGCPSSVQREKLVNTLSLHQETCQTTDKCSSGSGCGEMNSDSVLKEKISGASFCDDDDVENEVSCSKITRVASNDSANASRNKLLLHCTSSLSEPMTSSASKEGFEHHPFETIEKKSGKEPPYHRVEERDSSAVSPRARPLTNKERLLLRRQALKMTRRPVLAVGKSNVVTGIAKAIRDHFKKHHLAIVNVKGRAKGTSVQEVVFQLEQATGAVLVSHEPTKIILYRGWGGGVDIGRADSSQHDIQASVPSTAVSPELLEAMRLECGLSIN